MVKRKRYYVENVRSDFRSGRPYRVVDRQTACFIADLWSRKNACLIRDALNAWDDRLEAEKSRDAWRTLAGACQAPD